MEYFPLLALLIFALSIAAGIIILDLLFGPRDSNKEKTSMYECGLDSKDIIDNGRIPVSIKYYAIALFFIIFDIEIVFLYPVLVNFRNNLNISFLEINLFIGILVIMFIYVWRKGGLKWD